MRIFCVIALMACIWPATAQTAPASLDDLGAIDKCISQAMDELMPRFHVPGAVFVLIKDGKVHFARGYGFANLETKEPMNAERNAFRLGSITKLFTATALMQQFEMGRAGLEDPLSDHLQLRPVLTASGGNDCPIRLWNLLTHTAGLDSRYFNVLGRRHDKFFPLENYLEANLPPRVEPPGSLVHYSNFSAALSGLVVEKLSGQNYCDYVRENIFDRLKMEHTCFVSSDEIEPGLPVGYGWHAERYHPLSLAFNPVTPAGAASASGTDLARFLIALIGDGTCDGHRILAAKTVQLMRKQRFTNHPGFPGLGLGLLEYHKNGRRLLGHGGGILGYASMLYLVPELELGYFIAANRNEAFRFCCQVEQAFLDKFLPGPRPDTVHLSPPAERAKAIAAQAAWAPEQLDSYTGRFRGNRFPRSTFEKILGVVLPVIPEQRVRRGPGKSLILDNVRFYFFSSQATELHPLGGGVFERKDGRGLVAFRCAKDGQVTHMFYSKSPVASFEALVWYDRQLVHAILLAAFSALFVWGATRRILPWFSKKYRRRDCAIPLRFDQCATAFSLCYLLTPPIPLLAAFPLEWAAPALCYGLAPHIAVLLWLPYVSLIATPFLWYGTASIWSQGLGTKRERLLYLLLSGAAVAFPLYLRFWNLLQ